MSSTSEKQINGGCVVNAAETNDEGVEYLGIDVSIDVALM